MKIVVLIFKFKQFFLLQSYKLNCQRMKKISIWIFPSETSLLLFNPHTPSLSLSLNLTLSLSLSGSNVIEMRVAHVPYSLGSRVRKPENIWL